jgi:hypothetical protein
MNIKGKLHKKFPTVDVSEKFRKRDFVVEYNDGNPMYPQYISFQLTQDRCGLIEDMPPGSELEIEFNLRGREWTSPQGEVKYFNTLEVWRINRAAGAPPPEAQMPPPGFPPPDLGAGGDDLPF